MKSFLDEVAQKIINSRLPFESIKIIVPNMRGSLFLKNELCKKINKPVFAPEIKSIVEFTEELSGLKKSDQLDIIYDFYFVYQEKIPKKDQDTFDQFLGWAKVVLSDFNEIDSNLVNPKLFFDSQFSLRKIQHWSKKENYNQILNNQLKFWQQMPILYDGLKQFLKRSQKGFLGMLFRDSLKNLEHYLKNNFNYHFFVGFNALNRSEEKIIQGFLTTSRGEVIWDIDRSFYEDKNHTAGKFIRHYQKEWNSLRASKPIFKENFAKSKKIQIMGVSKNISQAKYAGQLSVDLFKN